MEYMLINFKTKNAHVKCVPLIPVTPEAQKAKVTKSQIQLLPGANYVTDDEWLIMKAHLSMEIGNGSISVIEKKVDPSKRAPSGKARNLREMPAGVAAGIIKETTNPETLRKWYSEETRDDVLLHIVKRMKAVKIDPTDIGKEDDEDIGNTGDSGSSDETDSSGGAGGKPLQEMNKNELIAYAKSKNLEVSGTKEEILAQILLEESDPDGGADGE
jgi:hypothetical protein